MMRPLVSERDYGCGGRTWHHPRPWPLAAAAPDLQELYRWAVQDPRIQVTFLSLIYHHGAGRWPRRLREDFAGNAADAVDWLAVGGEGAIAVDIDATALRWGHAARGASWARGPTGCGW